MQLREFFASKLEGGDACIENVRVIRDKVTFEGKGFGYLLLTDEDAVAQALALHESEFQGRKIRVTVCGKRFKSKGGGQNPEDRKVFEGKRASRDGALRRLEKKKQSKQFKKRKAGGGGRGRGMGSAKRGGRGGSGPPGERPPKKQKSAAAPTAGKDAKAKEGGKKRTQAADGGATKKPAVKGKKPKHAARKAAQAAAAAKGQAWVNPKKRKGSD